MKTITFDNDKEFAYHEKIKQALDVDTYFAHPYHSWERGLNENHNGLIRQYLPKGQALDNAITMPHNTATKHPSWKPNDLK